MCYRNCLLILISLFMFSFSEKLEAKYEKLFYDLNVKSINNKLIDLSEYKGKTVLIVNVASKCGFTKQYSGLQELYNKYKEKNFIVLAIPSNQFGGQEPGSNNEIKDFCDITFPITDKVEVKGNNAHEIYKWAKENHGKSAVPKWNFHKILVNKEGKIHDTFGSFTEPLSSKIKKQIELIL